jgi:hypothetical protein
MSTERVGLVLSCEGMGDCLFAMAVIRRLHRTGNFVFDLFTQHPALFKACPYIGGEVRALHDPKLERYKNRIVRMFEPEKLPYWSMDTFDFISVPLGFGELSFREKQLEYFPVEEDRAERFDVVLNTSMTWKTRTWPAESWQRLADVLLARGLTVAVVGKDVESKTDRMVKRSPALERTTNLVNQLSLDQTYFTIRKCGLFVTCQNGLSVVAGATDVEIVVLGTAVDWSKRAIYREESPLHKITYVKGGCPVYCGADNACPLPENQGVFKCIPTYEQVEAAVLAKLPAFA